MSASSTRFSVTIYRVSANLKLWEWVAEAKLQPPIRIEHWPKLCPVPTDQSLSAMIECQPQPPSHPLHHTPWPACVDHVTIDQCIDLHWWPLVSMCWLMFRPCYWPSVSCRYFFRVLTLLFADERQSTLHPPPFIPSAPVSKATELLRCKLFTGSSIHDKELSRIQFGSLKSDNEKHCKLKRFSQCPSVIDKNISIVWNPTLLHFLGQISLHWSHNTFNCFGIICKARKEGRLRFIRYYFKMPHKAVFFLCS